jgi:hypothetical protein
MAEDARVAAERRGLTALRYQTWENGQGGVQVCGFYFILLGWSVWWLIGGALVDGVA